MKIYLITSKLNFVSSGGSIEEIDLIIRTLQKAGNEVTVVTAHSIANDIPEPLPYTVIEENIGTDSYIGLQKNIVKLLKKYSDEADIFHIDAHLFVYGAGLYKLLGGKTPVVAFFNQYLSCWPQYESSLFPQPVMPIAKRIKAKMRWYIEKYIGMPLANRVDLFAFVSPTLRKMYEDFGIRKNDHDIVIGDPIDFEKIMREGQVDENSYSNRAGENDKIILFYSSRMSAGKGFDMLIKAFSCIKNKDNFRLILGGTGPEEKHVHNMVRDLGLQDYVEIPGWVSKEHLYENYRKADIFIQADWWPAGTSISLIYALAFGVPSILPGGGGLQWNAGEGAMYFKYRDYDELAQKIEQLGSDIELRKKLSRNCYARLRNDEMNPEIQIGKLDKAMRETVQKKEVSKMTPNKRKFFTKGKFPFILTFLVYLPVLFLFYKYTPPNPSGYSFPVLIADSTEYVNLAHNIIENKVFSLDKTSPFTPEYFRTPGYPIFLAFILLFFKSYYAASIVNIILVALTAFLIYKIGDKIINSTAGLVASFLYIVNGSTIFYAITVMSDILFTFLIVLAVYLMFFVKTKKEFLLMFGAGLLIGFSVLVRTIGIFLPFLFLAYYFFINRKTISIKKLVLYLSVLVIGFGAVLTPWIVRNKIQSGFWSISSLGGINLFSYNVPFFLTYKNNQSLSESWDMLRSEVDESVIENGKDLKNSKKLMSVAMKHIKEDPFGYTKFHLNRLPQYFGGNSSKNFYVNILEIVFQQGNPFLDKSLLIDDLLKKKDISSLWSRIKSQSFFPLEYIFWLIIIFLSAVSVFFRKYRLQALFFISIAMYFAVLTGPVVHVRYRVPAEPFMFLSALMGYYSLKGYLSKIKGKKHI